MIVPSCCVGCRHAYENECHKPKYCLFYRILCVFFKQYRGLPKHMELENTKKKLTQYVDNK